MEDEKIKLVLHLEESEMKDLRKMAQSQHRTMQGIVHDAIEDFLESYREDIHLSRQRKPKTPVIRLVANDSNAK